MGTVIFRPSADSSNSNWAANSGSVLYNRLSEATSDGDSTYISTATSGASYTCALSGALPSGAQVTGITLYVLHRSSGFVSETFSASLIVNSSSVTSVSDTAMPSAYTLTSCSASWTSLTLSNMSVTVSDTGTGTTSDKVTVPGTSFVTQIYAVVTFKDMLNGYCKINGAIKQLSGGYIKIDGVWKTLTMSKVNINSVWK